MAWLQQNLSAQEFVQWMEWMQAEQLGPDWQALRHAEVMAGLANGALQKPDKRPFTAADFLRPNPWLPADKRPRFLNPQDSALASMFEGAIGD